MIVLSVEAGIIAHVEEFIANNNQNVGGLRIFEV
jgi:hypothetical protein